MKKKVLALVLAACMTFATAACGNSETSGETEAGTNSEVGTSLPGKVGAESSGSASLGSAASEDPTKGEIVDGEFVETRKITVEVYDRGNAGGSDPADNMYTDYIKQGVLEDLNIEVEFVTVPRWTEVEQINNLLAAGDAPDICYTYDYPTIQTYAGMGGVVDLSPYVDTYKDLLTNLWDWLGEANIYWDQDPVKGTLWALEGKLAVSNQMNTFVRKDWLEALNLEAPTTTEEFEAMLIAFRDNAELLLGDEADKLIPYSVSYDVGWRANTLIESFIDPDISDKEFYVNGFDERYIMQNGTKEAVRLLNKWYNDDLMWDDFALYGSGDSTEDDMMKAGYIGAFTHNWDYPFRNGEDSINANLARLVGEDAEFVAIDPFDDMNGGHTKFVPAPVDRKVFFPSTNDEPLASLMYLAWISDPEHIQFLQIGEEGVTHQVLESGAIATIAAEGDAIQNSGMNIDYTMTCNGLKLADKELTAISRAYSYANVNPETVKAADEICNTELRVGKNVNVGRIEAEEGVATALAEKRDIVYDTAIIAPVADFDAVWDAGITEYLSSGAQAIIDERTERWEATYGTSDMLP